MTQRVFLDPAVWRGGDLAPGALEDLSKAIHVRDGYSYSLRVTSSGVEALAPDAAIAEFPSYRRAGSGFLASVAGNESVTRIGTFETLSGLPTYREYAARRAASERGLVEVWESRLLDFPIVAREVVIQFNALASGPDISALTRELKLDVLFSVPEASVIVVEAVNVHEPFDLLMMVEAIERSPFVARACVDRVFGYADSDDATTTPSQVTAWHIRSMRHHCAKFITENAQRKRKPPSVAVAIIDAGFSGHHKLKLTTVNSPPRPSTLSVEDSAAWDDCDRHGTRVAGVIGSTLETALGVFPGVELHGYSPIPLQRKRAGFGPQTGERAEGEVEIGALIAEAHVMAMLGLCFADLRIHPNIKVINVSLGMNMKSRLGVSGLDPDAVSPEVSARRTFDVFVPLLSRLRQAGILLTVSAGNEGNAECKHNSTLAYAAQVGEFKNILTVAAVDEHGAIWRLSNRGAMFSAPGVLVPVLDNGNGFVLANGTSYAAPAVAGGLALVMAGGGVGGEELVERLTPSPLASCRLWDGLDACAAAVPDWLSLLADVTLDGAVDSADERAVMRAIGRSGALERCDLNGDGVVSDTEVKLTDGKRVTDLDLVRRLLPP